MLSTNYGSPDNESLKFTIKYNVVSVEFVFLMKHIIMFGWNRKFHAIQKWTFYNLTFLLPEAVIQAIFKFAL